MELECRGITKLILPAVRASVAEIMSEKYDYSQEEIARRLGVVQVAVSKYLNKRYSNEVERMKSYIIRRGLAKGIIDEIVKGRDSRRIAVEIDNLCNVMASRA